MEVESRSGKVKLRFAGPDGEVEYALSADDAERFASRLSEGAERARKL